MPSHSEYWLHSVLRIYEFALLYIVFDYVIIIILYIKDQKRQKQKKMYNFDDNFRFVSLFFLYSF